MRGTNPLSNGEMPTMMNLFEMMQAAQGGNAMSNLANQFNLTPGQTQNAVEALLPALSMGLQRQTQSPDMFSSLAGMMMNGQHTAAFDADGDGIPDNLQQGGNDVLTQLFGSKQVTRAVAAQAEATSGIGAAILKQMLPVIASMVMGGLFKSASNQGLGGILGQLANGMAGGGQQQANTQVGNNPLGDLLGGLLGAGAAKGGAAGGGGMPAGLPGGLGDLIGQMMGGGQPSAQQAPRQTQQAGFDPASLGLESLTNMFNTGRQVQEDHQNGLQSIFDAMLGGQRR
jgi:hypothetical protein